MVVVFNSISFRAVFVHYVTTYLCPVSANIAKMGLIGVRFDAFLAFTEPMDDRRRISRLFSF